MKERFRKYLNKKFFVFFRSQQLDEYKEELLDGMMDRYRSYREKGESKEAAYQMTIAHFGDVTSGVSSLTEINLTTKEKIRRISRYALATALYWLLITTIYLTVCFISHFAFNTPVWGEAAKYSFPFGGLIFAAIALMGIRRVGHVFNKEMLVRLSLAGFIMVVATFLFLLISFILDGAKVQAFGTSVWAITWVILLAGFIAAFITDYVISRKDNKKKTKKHNLIIVGVVLFIGLYLLLSFLIPNGFVYTWLMFLFAIIGLIIFALVRLGKKSYTTGSTDEGADIDDDDEYYANLREVASKVDAEESASDEAIAQEEASEDVQAEAVEE